VRSQVTHITLATHQAVRSRHAHCTPSSRPRSSAVDERARESVRSRTQYFDHARTHCTRAHNDASSHTCLLNPTLGCEQRTMAAPLTACRHDNAGKRCDERNLATRLRCDACEMCDVRTYTRTQDQCVRTPQHITQITITRLSSASVMLLGTATSSGYDGHSWRARHMSTQP
jgi:hypothetical protein